MRIALITDAWAPQVNGVVTTLTQVTNLWKQAGHDLLIVQPGLFRRIPCPGYPEIPLSVFAGRAARRLLRDFNPQAIHIATEGPLGLAARLYCKRNNLPFTTSYHTQLPQYLRQYTGLPVSMGYKLFRWFHGPAERTLTPTQRVTDELLANSFNSVVTWRRGVDSQRFTPEGPTAIDGPRPVFLCVGRVAKEKNLEAFLSLDLPGSKWIVGDGPDRKRLQRKHPNARFLGFRFGNELAAIYRAADVFVFPSLTDTYGLVMLEAMASGTPVAAFPVTGPVDVVKHGVTGIMHNDLRQAALDALDLPRDPCRDHALTMPWSACADQLLANLERIQRPASDAHLPAGATPEPAHAASR